MSRIPDSIWYLKRRQYSILGYFTDDNIIYVMKDPASQLFTAHLIAHLRKMRVEAGLTQQQLAKKIGEPQSFVSKYEVGEKRLDLYQLKTICEAAGTNVIFFIKNLEDDRK